MELPKCAMETNEWEQFKCIKDFLPPSKVQVNHFLELNIQLHIFAFYYLTKISGVLAENRCDRILENILAPTETMFNKYFRNFRYLFYFILF